LCFRSPGRPQRGPRVSHESAVVGSNIGIVGIGFAQGPPELAVARAARPVRQPLNSIGNEKRATRARFDEREMNLDQTDWRRRFDVRLRPASARPSSASVVGSGTTVRVIDVEVTAFRASV
jgi:hypothetical protein